DLAAVAELARQACGLTLVALLVAGGAGLVAFFGAYAGAALAALLVTVVALRGRERVAPAFGGAWAVLRRAGPFAVAAAASVGYFRVTMIEMSLLASAHETGLFGASF